MALRTPRPSQISREIDGLNYDAVSIQHIATVNAVVDQVARVTN